MRRLEEQQNRISQQNEQIQREHEERQQRIREQNEMLSRNRSESYDGKDLKPCLTPAGEEHATLRQQPSEAIPPGRNYMGRVGLWLSQVGWEQRTAGEQEYGYANNNPNNYFDPNASEPQAKGAPLPGLGAGQCPGAAAMARLLQTMKANTKCVQAFQGACGKQATVVSVLKQINNNIIVGKPCPNLPYAAAETDCAMTRVKIGTKGGIPVINPDTGKPAIVDLPNDPEFGKQAWGKYKALDICFNSSSCSQPPQVLAGMLLWELVNVCDANLTQRFDENQAETVAKACGWTKFHKGGTGGIKLS